MKRIALYLTIAISAGTIIAGLAVLDSRWAKAARVYNLECRLDKKITQDQADWTQKRIWMLQDRYPDQMPQTVKEEYRQLKRQLKNLLNKLNQGYKG